MRYLVKVHYAHSKDWVVVHNSNNKNDAAISYMQTVNRYITKFGSPDKYKTDDLDSDVVTTNTWIGKCTVKYQVLPSNNYNDDDLSIINNTAKNIASTHYKCKGMPLTYGKSRTVANVLRDFYGYEMSVEYIYDVIKAMKGDA